MHVTIVHVHVRFENVDDFVRATKPNHEGSVREPGNLRFDVLQSAEDPARFILYEAYVDESAAKAHKSTAHYQTWRETVAPWMASPRRGVVHSGIFPVAENRE